MAIALHETEPLFHLRDKMNYNFGGGGGLGGAGAGGFQTGGGFQQKQQVISFKLKASKRFLFYFFTMNSNNISS